MKTDRNMNGADNNKLKREFIRRYYRGDFDFSNKELTEEIILGIKDMIDDEDTYNQFLELFGEDDGKECGSTKDAVREFRNRTGLSKDAPRTMSLGRSIMRIAAVVVPLFVVAGIGWYLMRGNDQVGPIAEFLPKAEQYKAELPDGSEAEIGSQTELKYFEAKTQQRIAELSGECRFSVVRDEKRPFVVRTSDLEVTVLGTEFTVDSRAGSDTTTVVLHSGKVAVTVFENEQVYYLEPDQKFIYIKGKKEGIITAVDEANRHISKSALAINDATMGEAIKAIETHFGVTFQLPEGVNLGGSYSIVYKENESLETALQILSIVNPRYSYTIKGDTVIME